MTDPGDKRNPGDRPDPSNPSNPRPTYPDPIKSQPRRAQSRKGTGAQAPDAVTALDISLDRSWVAPRSTLVVSTETNWLEALKPLDPTELVPKVEVFGGTEFEICRDDKDARGVVKEHGKLNANVSRCGQISRFGSFMILSAEEVWRANRFL